MDPFYGAEDRARTGHPDLGKVVLYQMSYFRNNHLKRTTIFRTAKITIPDVPQNFFGYYLYLGVYRVFSGTSTFGLPLYLCE